MKKEVLLTIFLFILIPFVSAEFEEMVFNDYVNIGDEQEIDGETFKFEFKSFGTLSLSVTFPDDYTLLIKFGNCNIHGSYSVCFDSIKKEASNTTNQDIHHWLDLDNGVTYTVNNFDEEELSNLWQGAEDYTTIKEIYIISARIFKRPAHISVTRKISKANLIIGEKIKIETTFINDGSAYAKNVRFEDYFPYPYLKFDNDGYTGCTWAGTSMKWEGNLDIRAKHTCSYTLTAFEPKTFSSKPQVKYYDGFKTQTEYGDETQFNIKEQGINLDYHLDQSQIRIGEVVLLDINLSNSNQNYTGTVDFSIETPEGLVILNVPYGMKWYSDHKLTYVGNMAANSKLNFPLQLRAEKAGHHNISLKNPYTVQNFRGTIKENILVEATIPKLKIYQRTTTSVLLPKQKTPLKISMENPTEFDMKDIDVHLISDLPSIGNITKWTHELTSGSSTEIFNLIIEAPDVAEETEFYITTTADYKSSFGQYFKVDNTKTITVKPREQEEVTEPDIDETSETTETQATTEEPEDTQEVTQEQEDTPVTILSSIKENIFKNLWFRAIDILLLLAVLYIIFSTARIKKRPTTDNPKNKIIIIAIITVATLLVFSGVGWLIYSKYMPNIEKQDSETLDAPETQPNIDTIDCGKAHGMHLFIPSQQKTAEEIQAIACFSDNIIICSPAKFEVEGGATFEVTSQEAGKCVISTAGKVCKIPLGFIQDLKEASGNDPNEIVVPLTMGLSNVEAPVKLQNTKTGERIDIECI